MLYLIRTFSRGNKTSLKIGFTDDLNTRMNLYKIHNPFFELITTRKGTLYEEMILHLYLEAIGYKEKFLNEWFFDVPDVNYIFHKIINNKMKKVIWNNREKLFITSDKDKIKTSIYWELYNLYFNTKTIKEIDKYFIFKRSSDKLKNMKKENRI